MAQGQPSSPGFVRPAAVAGRFYPSDADELASQVDACLATGPRPPTTALGIVVPHAGYAYSGAIAGALYARTEIPERVVVLAPNHTGRGARVALLARGALAIPGAKIPVDERLATALLATSRDVIEDVRAHEREHALEVQLPFLLRRRPDVRVTPLVVGNLSLATCRSIADGLVAAIAGAAPNEPVLIVASSDMCHYLPADETRRRDRIAIDRVVALDAEGLLDVVHRHGISMCGSVVTAIMILAARARGATQGELVAYGTSGDVTGDQDEVVGYAAVAVRADGPTPAMKAPAVSS